MKAKPEVPNTMFHLATELVCGTGASVFLTGNAGTGKTTFLRHIKEVSLKNLAIVAPTGVAAINAGGTTIHSFFQLPFSPFVPTGAVPQSQDATDAHALLGRMRLTSERRQVLRGLELLVIDEISMVRADTLDAIDLVLRHFRSRPAEPFGGVQLLMIGDMYQLPPVIKREEWQLLSQYYASGYFFDSRVMQQAPPVHIAFTHIYRQHDQQFIDLLNAVRNNRLDEEGLQVLHQLYQPGISAGDVQDRIILTTHNAKAEEINDARMRGLTTRLRAYNAVVDGEFSEKAYPAEQRLELKEGARVMFIKNDTEKVRRYYNGKIATVSRLEEDKVFVQLIPEEEEIEVKKEKWDNIRYGLSPSSKQIEEDVIGSFSQYPLRLAWAVTIHKSQGSTFEKAVIDAGDAFSPGQVYVALSRCVSLEGIILLSKISQRSLINDPRVVQFSAQEQPPGRLMDLLHTARHNYQHSLLNDLFDYTSQLTDQVRLHQFMFENGRHFGPELPERIAAGLTKAEAMADTAQKFAHQRRILSSETLYPQQNEALQGRVRSAAVYFSERLGEILSLMLGYKAQTESRPVAREYNDLFKEVYTALSLKKHLTDEAKRGFDVDRFYAAKKAFLAPAPGVNAYIAAAGTQDFTPSPHPLLHRTLRQLRDAICNESDLPVYLVASGKTLDELAEKLPHTKEQLEQVSGFGKAKAARFGDRFLEPIISYCNERGLASNVVTTKKKGRKRDPTVEKKVASALQSFELFRQGQSVAAIAVARNITENTVLGHLADFIVTGEMDVNELVPSQKIAPIRTVVAEIGTDSLGRIKSKLGDDFTFFDIKAVVQYERFLQRNAGTPEVKN